METIDFQVGRPVVRYHGGKWRLAPWIVAQMSEHRVLDTHDEGAMRELMRDLVRLEAISAMVSAGAERLGRAFARK